MSKFYSEYICQQCGYRSASYLGKCPQCGEWNSLVETSASKIISQPTAGSLQAEQQLVKLSDVKGYQIRRMATGFSEFDRVLGGGIVPGSIVLVSGDPGIGKSTLLLQTAMKIAAGSQTRDHGPRQKKSKKGVDSGLSTVDNPVLYVTGEESAQQVKIRADRLGKSAGNLYILPVTDVSGVIAASEKISPRLLIIDSIQTLTTEKLSGSAGSVGQVRECAQILQAHAKSRETPVFLVGHVTKEGSVAGPKVLEHIVDAVLNLEGDEAYGFRILRAAKNRFGSTFEVGVFEMADSGIVEITNP